IDDMVDAYRLFLDAPGDKIDGEIFNVGYENRSIADIAEIVKRVVEEEMPDLAPIAIERTSSDDKRSYHISSEKVRRVLGFVPKRGIEDAVRDLCRAFGAGLLPDSLEGERYYNVRTMKAHAVR